MIKVFISSPYTLGDVAVNVRNQMDCADKLIDLGFNPFTPLYYHFQHLFKPKDYEVWLKLDFEWLKECNCLLRLPGESSGADREIMYALYTLQIPVFYSIDELVKYYVNKD